MVKIHFCAFCRFIAPLFCLLIPRFSILDIRLSRIRGKKGPVFRIVSPSGNGNGALG